jgi:hypothetical protein
VDNTLVVVDRKPLVHFLDRATGANRNIVPLLDAGTVRADASLSADGKSAIIATTNGKLFRADPSATSITAIVVGAK